VLRSQIGFVALEDLDTEVEISTIWEMIRENIKISVKESLCYYEQKQTSSVALSPRANYTD
jgi:hypothetical protein